MAKLNPSTTPPPSPTRSLKKITGISRAPAPSPTILAVLASLVVSVHPFPVGCHDSNGRPPSFLCPSLEPESESDAQGFGLPYQTPPPSSPVPGPSSSVRTDIPTTPANHFGRNLAPGYTQGEDGRWRRLSTWSLYGSTVCVCHDASGPTGFTPVDDLATTPTPSATNEADLLPPGWSRTSEKSAFRTTLILSLSLVLAAVIVVFIIVIRLWRRKRKNELRKDVERTLVRRRGPSQSVESEKESRTKSKLWARATTRWRENVRQSARRRRNARLSSTSPYPPNNSVVSLSQTIASTTSSPHSRSSSLPPSRVSSPEPTVSIARSAPSSPTRTDHEPHTDVEPLSRSPPPAPPLPPAYQGRSLSTPDNSRPKDLAQFSPGNSPYDAHIAHIDSPCPNSPPPSPPESDTTPPNPHVAHVATDDKAVLRQMEVLSSQPPPEPGSSCEVHGSAPVLYEDDVESLEYEDGSEPVPSLGFPLPPTSLSSSKGKAAALEYYDYDDLDVEPDLQPSAPPFEAENPIVPSAPPQGEAQLHQSAPPEIADPGDDPTAPIDDCPSRQMGEQPVDTARPGPSSLEQLPRYRP